jgi:hypothetical protein
VHNYSGGEFEGRGEIPTRYVSGLMILPKSNLRGGRKAPKQKAARLQAHVRYHIQLALQLGPPLVVRTISTIKMTQIKATRASL